MFVVRQLPLQVSDIYFQGFYSVIQMPHFIVLGWLVFFVFAQVVDEPADATYDYNNNKSDYE